MKHNKLSKRIQGIYPPVFYPALILILIFSIFAIFFSKVADVAFSSVQSYLVHSFGWFYILGMATFLCICIVIMLSRLGNIKLGPDHSRPDYSYITWFAMLFSAGMGIGLMFYGVAEPLQHYIAPPVSQPRTIMAAKEALNISFFHWGLHAWSAYSIFGLSLSYFSYRHKLPLLPRSVLYPLLGKKTFGIIGHSVDVFAILGTMFGVATSLGLGVIQINAGLHYLFDINVSLKTQIILIISITLLATLSVASGLNKGIKILSNLNIAIAVFIMLFVLIFSHTISLLQAFVQNTGAYLSSIVYKTFNLYAYTKKQAWLSGWTLFYWGWWISWAPFVGMFIAKISRGRTIREFLVGVLFVPVIFTFIWITIFGNSAISISSSVDHNSLIEAVTNNVPIALFKFLEYFPLSTIISFIALVLIITFFITSSDSGSLIVDIMATGNAKNSITWQRIFWSLLGGVLAIALLYSGGLHALQAAAISSALPLLIIMFLMCVALIKALRKDYLKLTSLKNHHLSAQYEKSGFTWQKHLDSLLSYPTKKEAMDYMKVAVAPAIEKLIKSFNKNNLQVRYQKTTDTINLSIEKEGTYNFNYSVKLREFPLPDFLSESDIEDRNMSSESEEESNVYYRAEVYLSHGSQEYDIIGYTEDQVIADVLTQYEKHLYFLHLTDMDKNN